MKYLLNLLDNPQEKLRVIHIAGTSGKGSTAYLTGLLLQYHGFKVGLHVSPHLFDIRERFQIYSLQNNYSATHFFHREPLSRRNGIPEVKKTLLPRNLFAKRLNEIIPSIEKARNTKWGNLTFFELTVALALHIFYKERVDFTVIETGLGGLYDGTNVVENPEKLVLLTKIGFDHQKVLGSTLSAIAYQKSGIVKKGNTVITVQQKPTVLNTFYRSCTERRTSLKSIKKKENYDTIAVSKSGTIFDFRYKKLAISNLKLGLIGEHQAENAALALAGLCETGKQYGFGINESLIRSAFSRALFNARFQILKTKNGDVIFDGAHNPQKMKAFISSLMQVYPHTVFDFLISFSEGKNQAITMGKMLRYIVPIAHSITITDFELQGGDVNHRSVPLSRIANILNTLHFVKYQIRHVSPDSVGVNTAYFDTILKDKTRPLVITGSLYLIAAIYKDLMNAIKKYE